MTLRLTTPTNRDRIAEEAGKNLVEATFRMVELAKADPVGAFLQRSRLRTVYRQIDLLTDAIDAHPTVREQQLADLADVARRAA